MSKNAMAGAVTLCGVGLCMIGGAMMMQSGSSAHASVGALPSAAAAVASAATTQAGGEPTVVWYGCYGGIDNGRVNGALCRAWSDGVVEVKKLDGWGTGAPCDPTGLCSSPWIVVSTANQGFRAAADVNADELVDAMDLASVLNSWGDAPRVPFPPSDCPLNLVNP